MINVMGLEGVNLNSTVSGSGALYLNKDIFIPMAGINSVLSGQSWDGDNGQLQMELIQQVSS